MEKRFVIVAMFAAGAWFASAPARADCYDEAAKYQKVNPLVLRAIAWQESHNRPEALNKNANGSTDYGLMQINSIHLPTLSRYGITKDTLMEPCKSVYIAAWHLRRKMDKYGNTWQAIGAYHSETPSLRDKYARQIADILARWKLLPASAASATQDTQSAQRWAAGATRPRRRRAAERNRRTPASRPRGRSSPAPAARRSHRMQARACVSLSHHMS